MIKLLSKIFYFIEGYGSVLITFQDLSYKDTERLKSDWKMVGDYIRSSFNEQKIIVTNQKDNR